MTDEPERVDTSHLDGVEDGCGCAEVWEHLSEGRGSGTDGETDVEADGEEDAPIADVGEP